MQWRIEHQNKIEPKPIEGIQRHKNEPSPNFFKYHFCNNKQLHFIKAQQLLKEEKYRFYVFTTDVPHKERTASFMEVS
ncbi:hypothetical protein A0J61_05775 [Choanephora cucurbitarum]|uniref:Uncharacterized protein n=1 Tax=Choanephora cucurbitarum TaxID=101091 RepID=A0A1C7NB33_9FUNG|nr:hypothetical protein A0J61_05775 [Choanephora cucurbitarum]